MTCRDPRTNVSYPCHEDHAFSVGPRVRCVAVCTRCGAITDRENAEAWALRGNEVAIQAFRRQGEWVEEAWEVRHAGGLLHFSAEKDRASAEKVARGLIGGKVFRVPGHVRGHEAPALASSPGRP